MGSGGAVIFTCSTFLSKPNKLAQLQRALDSILAQHGPDERGLVRKVLVINEYGPGAFTDRVGAMLAKLPAAELIQKDEAARGQARTLNMILERLAGYEYWIHWEESWECTRPFLAEAIDAMASTDLTQLQLTPDWLDVGDERVVHAATPAGTRYARILPHPRTSELLRGATIGDYDRLVASAGMGVAWPLFSLRPGVNRAAFCRDLPRFSEVPAHWPVRFEWEYARRWFERGATKAVLTPFAAQRQPNHVSTYR